MRYRSLAFTALILSIAASTAQADGLIFQLPADGTWARYALRVEAKHTPVMKDGSPLPKTPIPDLSTSGTLTISSVGEVTRHEQKCRWIELKTEQKDEELHSLLLLKMLIPEEYLKRGQDPLAHAVTTFFNPKQVDKKAVQSYIDQGFNRVQYEIDRFRNVFPKPLDDAKVLRSETVNVKAGEFKDCEVIAGTSHYDGPLLNDGRMVYDGTYKITRHPKAPFGVVAMHAEIDDREYSPRVMVHVKATMKLTLVETGTGAVSELKQTAKGKPKH